MALLVARCLVMLVCCVAGLAFKPLSPASLPPDAVVILNGLLGLAAGGLGLVAEWHLRKVPFRCVAGALLGTAAGAGLATILLHAVPAGLVMRGWPIAPDLMRPLVYLLLAFLGMLVGAHKGDHFRAERLVTLFHPSDDRRSHKILDTSVIIDGRIADICETGFVDGALVIPQFVLRELQSIADSSDQTRRNRGRKGLEILQRIKKSSSVDVILSDMDFPQVREVDQKLIELARSMGARIVTNDFNLNKVAQLHGVKVLNINDLANALKPVVLPGESMKVFVLKEGKEPSQGVGYLDDGTMVVVDNARRQIGKTIDITVTSVLQTTAGKMIFGRYSGGDGDKPSSPAPRRPPREREPSDPGEASASPEASPPLPMTPANRRLKEGES